MPTQEVHLVHVELVMSTVVHELRFRVWCYLGLTVEGFGVAGIHIRAAWSGKSQLKNPSFRQSPKHEAPGT